MKILMVNKFLYLTGGVERYMFDLIQLLERHHHEVVPFAMNHEKNVASDYASYFVSRVDLAAPQQAGSLFRKLRTALRVVYSTEARRKVRRIVLETQPDVAHLHSICYQITPSILYELRDLGIPVIQTVHELKLVCPNQRLFNLYTGQVCEKCAGHRYYQAVVQRCMKNSWAASFLGCMEAYIYHFARTYRKTIDAFIVPSEFHAAKLCEMGGIERQRIFHIPHAIDVGAYAPSYDSDKCIVFIGRLSAEKGVLTLVRAMKDVRDVDLILVGDGPQRAILEAYVLSHGLTNVKFAGWVTPDDLKCIASRTRFVVLPSEWYENSPLVIYEAFALGKPVLGSNRGGIPELVEDGVNGLLFEAGNVSDLATKIEYLLDRPALIEEMGRNARTRAEREFDLDMHYERIMGVYSHVLETRQTYPRREKAQ